MCADIAKQEPANCPVLTSYVIFAKYLLPIYSLNAVPLMNIFNSMWLGTVLANIRRHCHLHWLDAEAMEFN